jgi:ubiquinone/menaquinone biosynthesis C-methylase UbiE
VVDQVLLRAKVQPGQNVLDVGTGTGAVALRVARLVGAGKVVALDVSLEMLRVAKNRAEAAGLTNVRFNEGRAESLPVDNALTEIIVR